MNGPSLNLVPARSVVRPVRRGKAQTAALSTTAPVKDLMDDGIYGDSHTSYIFFWLPWLETGCKMCDTVSGQSYCDTGGILLLIPPDVLFLSS